MDIPTPRLRDPSRVDTSFVFPSISGVGSCLEISPLTIGQSFESLGFRFRSYLQDCSFGSRPAGQTALESERAHEKLSFLMPLQSFLRLVIFFAPFVVLRSLLTRAIQLWLASRCVHPPAPLVLSVQVTPVLLGATGVWSDTVWLLNGVPLLV